ncbi:uncharacterized protein LOC126911839 [Spodoptera frugiperda]|uniref:Uncharacterized protein LOC126911839 n=1 Tax=Spodoptera frugiperda TaxID=7108 RepID=A0A9R0E1P3_SPOFR|nr:uncharacterized protein LOC126911839 [Spodoptera frugiperda]
MGQKCRNRCYFGCIIGDSPLHHFPNPKSIIPDQLLRYAVWKTVLDVATQEKGDTYIYDQIRLCNKHFLDCYQLPSRQLTRNAVPTLNLGDSDGNTAESIPIINEEQSVPVNKHSTHYYIDIDTANRSHNKG